MLPNTHERKSGHMSSIDSVSMIEEDIRKLGLDEYSANRTSLLRRRNNAEALTKDLPPEIISLIFQLTLIQMSTFDRLKCALLLGQISFHWRQIAWSTPQLWASMTAIVNYSRCMDSTLQLLQLHLHNVRGLPFSLEIYFPRGSPLTEESLSGFVELLSDKENSGKIRSLALSHSPGPLTDCLSNGTFLNLECLDLVPDHTQLQQEFSLINLPSLRKLCLAGTVPKTIELSWLIVTSLVLDFCPIDISMGLFLQCPNLIDAHILSPAAPSSNASGLSWTELTDTITFPHLTKLSWSYPPDPIYLFVFRRICAPSLRALKCSGGPGESLLPELPNFPSISTLTHLGFENLEDSSRPLFREIFARTQHLQSLQFVCCDHADIEDAISILDPATEPEDQPIYLPSLNELRIYDKYSGHIHVELQWAIFKLIERQRAQSSGVGWFRLELVTATVWDPEVKQAIRSLIQEGFELEIIQNNGMVPWLDDYESESYSDSYTTPDP